MHKNRYLSDIIEKDLSKKMVFLGGPRQVGKTTLALSLLGPSANESHPSYFNWDFQEDRKRIQKIELPQEKLIIFDELHKYPRWRGLLKGLYDKTKSSHSYLVTGSARLDVYRRGGTSLQGRYFYHRLHPYSLGEFDQNYSKSALDQLLKFSGFPEPLLSASEEDLNRWNNQYYDQVIKEDLRDLESVREISLLQLLVDELPECVGSPLSMQKFSKKLEISAPTVKKWIEILERLYLIFRIPPFGSRKIRAVKKEQKLYFWNWTKVEDPGSRFENLVASQLLKHCHYHEDVYGKKMELRYLRDTDKREVDFIVLEKGRPQFAVECKTREKQITTSVKYFSKKFPSVPFYQVHLNDLNYKDPNLNSFLLPFHHFCQKMSFC